MESVKRESIENSLIKLVIEDYDDKKKLKIVFEYKLKNPKKNQNALDNRSLDCKKRMSYKENRKVNNFDEQETKQILNVRKLSGKNISEVIFNSLQIIEAK